MAMNGNNQSVLEDYFDQLLMPAGPEEVDLSSPIVLLEQAALEQATALQNLAAKIGARSFQRMTMWCCNKTSFKNMS